MQRLVREHRLLQRQRSAARRRRPGFLRLERPNHLWRLDMTSIWVAGRRWRYLNTAIDCRTREICGWALDLRCRAPEAITVINAAAPQAPHRARRVDPGDPQRLDVNLACAPGRD